MVLSGNSIEHALLMLGCYSAGVPIVSLSPQYSQGGDFARLRNCNDVVRPKLIFAQSEPEFSAAMASLEAHNPALRFASINGGPERISFAEMAQTPVTSAVADAISAIKPSAVAKYLFTSGSSGLPKAVIQTHGMLMGTIAADEALSDGRPLPDDAKMLEWMPWSHIAGGNYTFNAGLWAGLTNYLDEGKPHPDHFHKTIENLYEVSPINFGSMPIGYAMLVDAMEADPKLRSCFFRNLQFMHCGGAALDINVLERLEHLAIAERGVKIPLITKYGSTEVQIATMLHWIDEGDGLIGNPVPGITLKLVPKDSVYEIRIKGPTVSPGYIGEPEKSAAAFDDEGFYMPGDACSFAHPEDRSGGLVFAGRIEGNFKLDTGTWVHVEELCSALKSACAPFIEQIVIVGEGKPYLGALIWPPATLLAERGQAGIAERLSQLISAFNSRGRGSSTRVRRVAIMTVPLSADDSEITLKGAASPRVVLSNRKDVVTALYSPSPADTQIIHI
ncbi:feruloyl-CoA synthetase [Sphingobium fuliginis]|uniref:Feruloyl-CoA synthetase n=3 Tax=Sphingobium TaxID=165695 RepID=A0A292ZAX9_SPHSA|nr:feruloyl-CoA synthetase [Sphingobium fuliginis]